MKTINGIYQISILSPAGNITALVKGLVDKKDKKRLNDQIMSRYPLVEQVGFYETDLKDRTATLEMAGGEFCGNATRSLAYLVLDGKPGKIKVKVSGTNKVLKAGIKLPKTSYAQMPIYRSFECVKTIDKYLSLVRLGGISHLITPKPNDLESEELKTLAKKLLKKVGLLKSSPASGVMFTSYENGLLKIDPVVWVRDIKTLFYETACASGTTAVALWKSLQNRKSKTSLIIKQPSQKSLKITIEKDRKKFNGALIEGPMEVIKNGKI